MLPSGRTSAAYSRVQTAARLASQSGTGRDDSDEEDESWLAEEDPCEDEGGPGSDEDCPEDDLCEDEGGP